MRPRAAAVGVGLVLLALVAGGCERRADVGSPRTFSDDGLTFKYPGNWKVEPPDRTNESGVALRTLTVDSPGEAVLMIFEFKPPIDIDQKTFATNLISSMRGEVKSKAAGIFEVASVATSPVERNIDGAARPGTRLRYSLRGAGVSVPHTGHVYTYRTPERAILVFHQVADEDSDKARPGFELIVDSLTVPKG